MRKETKEDFLSNLKNELSKQMSNTGVINKGSEGMMAANDMIKSLPENETKKKKNKNKLVTNLKMNTPISRVFSVGTVSEEMKEEWSEKYKKSIDCNNPKGFSQRAHCQGKKLKENLTESERTAMTKLRDLAKKYANDKSKGKTSKESIELIYNDLKDQYRIGLKVEKEHKSGDPKQIVLDHLSEDPKYYTKLKKAEATEATGSGSAGAFSGPIAFADSQFVRNSLKEKPKKIETKEATGSGSAGSYETTAAWAKTTKKKDWRGASKTQIPGGKFVQVKKKCKKFPYCNQGDINALKLWENETVKKVISKISKEHNISEQVIKNIIVHELQDKIK